MTPEQTKAFGEWAGFLNQIVLNTPGIGSETKLFFNGLTEGMLLHFNQNTYAPNQISKRQSSQQKHR